MNGAGFLTMMFCNVCVWFQVIHFRNELMHSCEFRVKDEWMRHYQTTVKKLVRQFSHVPQMTTVGQQIEEVCVCVWLYCCHWSISSVWKSQLHPCCFAPQFTFMCTVFVQMLTVDLSICVSGLDRLDSANLDGLESDSVSQWETSADLIIQWEAELLQERLQDLLNATADDDDRKTQVRRTLCPCALAHLDIIHIKKDVTWLELTLSLPQDTEQLKRLRGFLRANRDLGERFSAELQAISSLEAREWKGGSGERENKERIVHYVLYYFTKFIFTIWRSKSKQIKGFVAHCMCMYIVRCWKCK